MVKILNYKISISIIGKVKIIIITGKKILFRESKIMLIIGKEILFLYIAL